MTLPASRAADGRSVTIAVAVTYTPDSFDDWGGSLANLADPLALELAAELVPDDPPPTQEGGGGSTGAGHRTFIGSGALVHTTMHSTPGRSP